jgi:Domain of unknown function (DUF4386)
MTDHTDLRPLGQRDQEEPSGASARREWWTVRRAGVLTGSALLLMAAAAAFAYFVVLVGMITPGDAAATAAEIVAREGTLRLGVLAWFVIAILDVVVAWALYLVFRPVSAAVSMLAAAFRLVYSAVLMVAVGQLMRALDVLTGDTALTPLGADQAAAHALLELSAFQGIYDAGLVLFGVHLALLGYLALRSDGIPRVVGALLVVAGAGYVLDTVAAVLVLDLPLRVATVTFVGELLLGLWLLVAGRRLPAVGTAVGAQVRSEL